MQESAEEDSEGSFEYYRDTATPRADLTTMQGLSWDELKERLKDPKFDRIKFMNSLT